MSTTAENGVSDAWTRRETFALTGGALSLAVAGLPESLVATEGIPEDATMPTSTVELIVNGRPRAPGPRPAHLPARSPARDIWTSPGPRRAATRAPAAPARCCSTAGAINACLTLAVMHDGAEITTDRGPGRRATTLHPLQAAFIEHEGFQCGYCTPGQIMSGVACIAEGHAGSPDEIRAWMSGNICRCGAYPGHRRRDRRQPPGGS